MSKGLEALDGLRFDVSMAQYINYLEANKECDIIEKELKALEIIKNKKVNVDALLNCYFLCEYNEAMDYTYNEIANNFFLTQEEFDLLKEVLE